MKILLDTNIIIHRESSRVIRTDIGILFNWIDKLQYSKYIHPLTLYEIKKHSNPDVVQTIETKIQNYNMLRTEAPEVDKIVEIRKAFDTNENDAIDTSLLKEIFSDRIDFLITEDKKIHIKAKVLGISERVFTIESFLEKVTVENPGLSDYKVLSVKKEYFGNIDISDQFFESLVADYQGFKNWFNKKSDEIAYICRSEDNAILAFLYLKIESEKEYYGDIEPILTPKKRLKIGTFKVTLNGYKLGERFLKIIFDNAIINKVDEIYVTIFNKTPEQQRLTDLLENWGFFKFGIKNTNSGEEIVYIKDFTPSIDFSDPHKSYPFIDSNNTVFIVPIYPNYHTELFPDSILNNESPNDFIENRPNRNAIQKVYISRSYNRNLKPGDIIVFYRTGGYYKSVVTTIGIVDSIITDIKDEDEFVRFCRKRSVFSDNELRKHWNYNCFNRPFIVNFLYVYSLPKRPNLKKLIEIGIIRDTKSAPRGFESISKNDFKKILKESKSDESFVVH